MRYDNLRFEVDTVGKLSRYRDHDAVLFAEITWYLLDELESVLESLRSHSSGKYFLQNLVLQEWTARRARVFHESGQFIARVPFALVARMEGIAQDMDTIETSSVFWIP